MRNIKLFEEWLFGKKEYKIGDMVVIRRMSDFELIQRGFPVDDLDGIYSHRELFVRLIKTPDIWRDGVKPPFSMKVLNRIEKYNKPYTGELFKDVYEDGRPHIIRLEKGDILRKMTTEEINED